MSAPDTNIDRQSARHKGPLAGMALVVMMAAVLLAALVIWTFYQGGEPEGAPLQIDGRTGAIVETQ